MIVAFPYFAVLGGDYTFEVIAQEKNQVANTHDNQPDPKDDGAKKQIDYSHFKEIAATAQNNYKNVMKSSSDIYIAKAQLTYNQSKEKELLNELASVEKELELLPKIVRNEYPRINNVLQSTSKEAAENTWISFEETYRRRKNDLENKVNSLRSDLAEVQARISGLLLEVETKEGINNLSNPFLTNNKGEKTTKQVNADKALQARNNLKNIAYNVNFREAKSLLSNMQFITYGLCEFSCGKSSCYVCNLLYGKGVKK